MKLELIRKEFTEKSTIGDLLVNGKFFCYTLEDKDRNLFSTDDLKKIESVKVYGQTAIPYGIYSVTPKPTSLRGVGEIDGKLPMIENIKGFAGVFIHSGNTPEHTKGCPLVGSTKSKDFVGNSKATLKILFEQILKERNVTIEIKKSIQI